MNKGYRGAEGTIVLITDSKFQICIISLDNGLRIAAGPSAFVLLSADQWILALYRELPGNSERPRLRIPGPCICPTVL